MIKNSPVKGKDSQHKFALSLEEKKEAYRKMLLVRRFEEKTAHLYGMGEIHGFCHLYSGQEAIAVGISLAMKEGDRSVTSYRDHGQMLVAGMDPGRIMAELTGRADGYSHGKGGSMHMFSRKEEFYGGHGIVGAQISIGTGLAFASMYRQDNTVAVAYMGEGASNQGQVYECFNLAALLKLPIVFVIENNRYGMGTSQSRSCASKDLSQNGRPWGIPGKKADGMKVETVFEAASEAIEHCRSGQGPFLLEMDTYRYRGHSMSDPARYRSRSEVDEVRKTRDPLEALKQSLFDEGVSESFFKELEAQIRGEVAKAADFAEKSPQPDPSELWTDVIAEEGETV
ncbi:pyruvate dehydrogenase (acetyl-transferring) E1 component subunit alpha [Acetobacteraceae bacterium]|nr:pyruvate dehydrogenase (acetyl-transferring) E1 component subunit alpha [Acetobacteraceae bacterium]